jgi:transposase
MLKIVHLVCCGIDVHKKFVVATIGTTNAEGVTEYQTRTFTTFTHDLEALRSWLVDHDCFEVCMESTGKYWIPVFNILESACHVTLANPKYVKGIRGKKTDKKDSLWLCDLHKHGLAPGSFIPPLTIRQIRDLMRYRTKLIGIRSSEKNRIQNSLTVSNIMIANVVSSIFGKSAQRVIGHILENPSDTKFDVAPLLSNRLTAKPETISLSIQGTLTEAQAAKMSVCYSHMDTVNTLITLIESEVLKLALPRYQRQVDILMTMVGIQDIFTAIAIIGEIGADMSVFLSAKHLASWTGLAPQNNESAGKKKSIRISRAGQYIKPLLVQCAWGAITSKDCPYFRARFEQISRRRGKKKAIIAIAHMLLNCIYHMLSKDAPFDPDLYTLEKALPAKRTPNITKDLAVAYLESIGAHITFPEPTPLPNTT